MLKTIFAAVLLTAVTAPAANAAHWYDQCLLWKDRNFQGDFVQLHSGDYVANFDNYQNFNDDTSSIEVKGTCRLTIYHDKHFKGWNWTIGSNQRAGDLGNENDDVSSAKCICS